MPHCMYPNGKLNLILSGQYFFSLFEIEKSLFRLRLFIGLAETMQIFTEQTDISIDSYLYAYCFCFPYMNT